MLTKDPFIKLYNGGKKDYSEFWILKEYWCYSYLSTLKQVNNTEFVYITEILRCCQNCSNIIAYKGKLC